MSGYPSPHYDVRPVSAAEAKSAGERLSKADIRNQKKAAAAQKHTTLRSPGVPVTRNIRNER